jgi:16S rRNA (adenine1518-N6/adenine1519-N6)-dimethyltransferase
VPRRLGQHFLVDPAILDRIVDAIDPAPSDVVLELGAGKGTLTRRLAFRVGHVVAIEKDPTLAGHCRHATRDRPVTVVEGDALELDWPALHPTISSPPAPFPIPHSSSSIPPSAFASIVGNIPYYIASPLVEKALTPPLARRVVFTVQREFADRMAAAPGSRTYGALSVGVQVAAHVERLFVVRAGSFQPPPKVDSAVVRLVPRTLPPIPLGQLPEFRTFVVALFGQRRKQLRTSLRSVRSLSRQQADQALEALAIDPAIRPEVLSPQHFVALFERVRLLTPRAERP